MQANADNFCYLRKEDAIEVPFFQRAYVWEKKQQEKLFDDLKEAFYNDKTKGHFLGSIILRQMETTSGSHRKLIDGQQRFTTFSILVKALKDKLDSSNTALIKKASDVLYADDGTPKIKHSRLDTEAFGRVLAAESFEKLEKSEHSSKIFDCYKLFSKKIADEEKNLNIKDFLETILDRKIWVIITLGKEENEQTIFDSINSTGMELTSADIIKNSLFSLIKDKDGIKRCEEDYKKYWESVFEKNPKEKEFWESKADKNSRQQIERFLWAYAFVKNIFEKPPETFNFLVDAYKKELNNYKEKSTDELWEFFGDLEEYARLWKEWHTPFAKNENFIFGDNLKWEKQIAKSLIASKQNNNFSALILFLLKKLENHAEQFKECLHYLNRMLFTNRLCSRNLSAKLYTIHFFNLIRNIQENNVSPKQYLEKIKEFSKREDGYSLFASKDEIIKTLKDKKMRNQQQMKTILFWVELYRREKNSNDFTGITLKDFDEFSLEHILPQSLIDKDIKGWESFFEEKDRASLIYKIGNMTLLKPATNSDISNKSFSDKKKEYQNTDLKITKELLEYDAWSKETITQRTKKFIEDFFSFWREPVPTLD